MSEIDETADQHSAEPEASAPATPAGESKIDAALGSLADLDSIPLAQHPDVYQGIHATLQEALAEIDGN